MSTADVPSEVAPAAPPAREGVPGAVIALLVVLGLACAPWLVLHFGRMMAQPHYQFVAIVPIGALVLAWRDRQGLGQLTAGPVRGTQLLAAGAWVLLFLAGFFSSGLLGLVATLLAFLAGFWALGGAVLLRALLPAWLFLWLLFPLPLGLDLKLIAKLQSLVSWETSRVLDLLGIIHVMAGNVIEVPGRRLLVEDACSGIHSLFAVLTCTVFFVLWNRCSVPRSLYLIAAAGFWVLLANAVRVVTIAVAFTRWGVDLSAGWQHEALGWVLFAGTLGLLWSSDGLYLFFATRQREEEAPAAVLPPVPATRLPAWGTLGLQPVPAIAAFGLLALLQGALFWAERTSIVAGLKVSPAEERMKSMTAESLPEKIGPWRRVHFSTSLTKYLEDQVGIASRVWTYQAGAVSANVSADFFFPGWHDLRICYGSQGWVLQPARVYQEQGPDGAEGQFIAVAMDKPLEQYGYLWFGLVGDDGRLWPPQEDTVGGAVITRSGTAYRQLWARLQGDNATKFIGNFDNTPTCQVQVFIESYAPLGERELAEGQNLFLQARALFRQRLRE